MAQEEDKKEMSLLQELESKSMKNLFEDAKKHQIQMGPTCYWIVNLILNKSDTAKTSPIEFLKIKAEIVKEVNYGKASKEINEFAQNLDKNGAAQFHKTDANNFASLFEEHKKHSKFLIGVHYQQYGDHKLLGHAMGLIKLDKDLYFFDPNQQELTKIETAKELLQAVREAGNIIVGNKKDSANYPIINWPKYVIY